MACCNIYGCTRIVDTLYTAVCVVWLNVGFYVKEFVLDDRYFVDVFVVGRWFEVYEEYVEGFFCLPMFDIDYVPHFMP